MRVLFCGPLVHGLHISDSISQRLLAPIHDWAYTVLRRMTVRSVTGAPIGPPACQVRRGMSLIERVAEPEVAWRYSIGTTEYRLPCPGCDLHLWYAIGFPALGECSRYSITSSYSMLPT